MNKILIIAPSWVGDMVMAQSLFKLLKTQHPNVKIDVLAPDWTAAILQRMPEVNQVISMPVGHGRFGLITRYKIGKSLRVGQYDQAIVLPNSWKSALIPFFARIKKRTGWLGEYRFGLLNDYRRLDESKYPLMIERFMALGLPENAPLPKPYPTPQFQIEKTHQEAALQKFKPIWRGKPILALSAGAAFGPSKQWPVEYFAEVANKKMEEGYDVWLFGAAQDKSVTDKIMALTNNQCENFAGRLELYETIDLLSLVSGVVANDSGLLHVAAALNKPLIAIYGSTSPDFTPPLSDKAIILKLNLECQPCFQRTCPLKHHNCMRQLTPSIVLNAMREWSKP